jgi:hypothetical protein
MLLKLIKTAGDTFKRLLKILFGGHLAGVYRIKFLIQLPACLPISDRSDCFRPCSSIKAFKASIELPSNSLIYRDSWVFIISSKIRDHILYCIEKISIKPRDIVVKNTNAQEVESDALQENEKKRMLPKNLRNGG